MKEMRTKSDRRLGIRDEEDGVEGAEGGEGSKEKPINSKRS